MIDRCLVLVLVGLLGFGCGGEVEVLLENPELGEGAAPVIPPNDPHREGHAGGFVPNAGWYGEPGWAEVRMRVAGHLSTAGRDRARLAARSGDRERAAVLYDELHRDLSAIPQGDGVAKEVMGLLVQAAERDARRMRGEDIPREPVPEVDLDAFEDFDARHELRVTLWRQYLASLDPADFDEPWGYWPVDVGAEGVFTREGIGALPTGDTLIDLGGEPGPRAIGQLAVLGLEDPSHQAWLSGALVRLNASKDEELPGEVRELIEELQRKPYGSRYYNIKQLRNEGVRVLARRGRYDLALSLLRDNFPLHDHDWACPNREGILLGLEGRLMALAGDPGADAKLEQAVKAARSFLDEVSRAPETPSGPHTPGTGPQTRPPPPHGPPPR